MADFRAAWTAGVAVAPWTDPGRLNPRPEYEHRRHVGAVGVQVTLTASVDGTPAPLDAALATRLFTTLIAECPVLTLPLVTTPAGQSSVARFVPAAVGHYTLRMVREGGGSIFLHLDVD